MNLQKQRIRNEEQVVKLAEEFSTNPGKWTINGNLIGDELGTLSDLSGFINDKCTVTSDSPITVNGKTFNVIKLTYAP